MANYDLVVVGTGSAGGVIATRITEDPKKRALLLEAGPDYARREELREERNLVRWYPCGRGLSLSGSSG